MGFETYNIIQWLVLSEKIIASLFLIVFIIFTYRLYRKGKQKQIQYLLHFYGFFEFYVIINIINTLLEPHFRLVGLGIAFIGWTLSHLNLLRYSFYMFHLGNYIKEKKFTRIYRWYLVVGLLSSIIVAYFIYVYHDYETRGETLPITAVLFTLPYYLFPLAIYLMMFLQILRIDKKIHRDLSEVISYAEKQQYSLKSRWLKIGCIIMVIMATLLYIDSFFSLRTILAVFGWILLIFTFFILYWINQDYNNGTKKQE